MRGVAKPNLLFPGFIILLICAGEAFSALEQISVNLFFNGKKKEAVGLALERKNAFLPDAVFEKYYGGTLTRSGGKYLTWEKENKKVVFELNSSTVVVDTSLFFLNTGIKSVSGYFLIPFEFLISGQFESLSRIKTYWYESKRVVSIRTDRETDIIDKLMKQVNREKIIVIDAGHGGHDVGAKLKKKRGIYEKDLNLKVAKILRELLGKNKKYQVIMTRDSDLFVPLDVRTRLANDAGADLFVSVHANACSVSKRSGFEIYFLSEQASDKEAEEVADYENLIIDLEGNQDFKKKILESILFSLGQNEFMNESSEVAFMISEAVGRKKVIYNRGVKQAGFFVLRGVMLPSVLVELGYMTNRADLKLMNTQKFQKNIAQAIIDGIDRYFKRQEQKEAWKTE